MREQVRQKSRVPVLILAAGQSSRMGERDKHLERVDGLPLLRVQVLKAKAVSDRVVVGLAPQAPQRDAVLEGLGVEVLRAPDHGEGMGGTLRNGLSAFAQAPLLMILLADLPEVTARDIATVLEGPTAAPDAVAWRGATAEGAPGHPILLSQPVIRQRGALSGDCGARELLMNAKVHKVPLPGAHARRDLDEPKDWTAWRTATGR